MLYRNPTSGLSFSATIVRDRSGRYCVGRVLSASSASASPSSSARSISWYVPPKRFGGSTCAPRPRAVGRRGSDIAVPLGARVLLYRIPRTRGGDRGKSLHDLHGQRRRRG